MSVFDTTQVQDVKAHKETSIVGGTNPYEGIPQMLQIGAEVGKGVMLGRAQAQLTGAEGTAQSVSTEDRYGTYTYEDGEPVELNIDQDLTRITNARKQGNISAERARALVNIRLRQAINDNPMFAKELQQRGQRFFDELGGGARQGVGGGNILQPTSEEQLEQKIHERNVMDLRSEELQAQQFGMSVPEWRKTKREEFDRQQARDRMSMRREEAQYAESMTEQERASAAKEFNHDIGMLKVDAQLQVGAEVNRILEQSPEGITAETRAGIRNQIQGQSNEFLALLNANRATLGTEEYKRQRQEIESWRDNMIGVVEEADLEDLYQAVRDRGNVLVDMQLQKEMPLIYGLGRVDPELARLGIELITDRDRLEMLARTNPSAQFVLDNESIFENMGLGTMVANSLQAAATGDEEARAKIPGSDADKDNMIDMEWLMDISGQSSGGEQMHDRAWDNFRSIVDRQGAVALNAATTPKAQREVRSDPEKQEALANTFDYALRGMSLAIQRGDIDLSRFNIEIPDRGEHDPRRPGDHPKKNQSWLSSSFWNERRFGHTGGPTVNIDMAAVERQIQQESWGTIPDYDRQESIREAARQIESLARIASTYPELEREGTSLMDMFVETFGMGQQMREEYGMSQEQAQQIEEEQRVPSAPIPGPFERGEREVDQGVEDLEFTDAREQFAGDSSRSLQQSGFEVQQPEVISEGVSSEEAVNEVFKHLAAREGVGDDVTDVPTGALGVTQAARDAVGADENTPDDQVARQYLQYLDSSFTERLQGYSDAPEKVKEMILDAAYNMGEGIASFRGFSSALAAGNYEEAGKQLLDTANVGGKSLRGLARRRAESYNLLADDPITTVEQLEDGTIRYLNQAGDLIFEYTPREGKHEKSRAGRMNVT